MGLRNSAFTGVAFLLLSRYFVLLMLTDGIISDMDQTKEAIVTVNCFHCLFQYFGKTFLMLNRWSIVLSL